MTLGELFLWVCVAVLVGDCYGWGLNCLESLNED